MEINTSLPTSTRPIGSHNQYWTFQLAGWSAMALLSYLSLNIWYSPGQLAPVMHSILQSVAGIFMSHPLRGVARRTWNTSLVSRVLLNGMGLLIAASAWTVWRILSFTWITGDDIEFTDWGGWINASVIVFAAWVFCYHALRYYRSSFNQRQLAIEAQTKAQHESLKRLEAEQLFRESQLRMQLNPHFILNALNSVSSLVRREDRASALKMLARIGDFLRASLDDSDQLLHTLGEELDALDAYLSIERVRFGDRLVTEFDVDAGAVSTIVPSLLLQPLFENAIKHAVSKQMAPTTIHFKAEKTQMGLRMCVSDNGPDVTKSGDSLIEVSTGVGLANVKSRLESTYGDQFEISVTRNHPSGMAVGIEINGSPSISANLTQPTAGVE